MTSSAEGEMFCRFLFEPKDIINVILARVLLIGRKRILASLGTLELEDNGFEVIRAFNMGDSIACIEDLWLDIVVLDADSM